jgi:hypothetical protein
MAPGGRPAVHEVGGLKLLVVGPRARELEKLRKEWRDWVAKLRAGNEPAIRAAENLDQSVFNLSSIVCLAEFGGKRMLLTGDARGDLILGGLEEAALIEPGEELKLDLLKLPHHGSDRNVDAEFFARLPADHYVASGNGVHGNPEVDTLRMISTARPKDDFTLHLTYEDCEEGVGAELAQFFAAEKRAGRGYEVVFRDPDDLSLRVDLLGELSV